MNIHPEVQKGIQNILYSCTIPGSIGPYNAWRGGDLWELKGYKIPSFYDEWESFGFKTERDFINWLQTFDNITKFCIVDLEGKNPKSQYRIDISYRKLGGNPFSLNIYPTKGSIKSYNLKVLYDLINQHHKGEEFFDMYFDPE